MIASWNQTGFPERAEASKAQRQYARIAIVDEIARTYPRSAVEYCARERRCRTASAPSSLCSAERFPVTTNIAPAAATMRNQLLIGTPTATPPATARRTKPDATAARSSTGSCFSQALYVIVIATYAATTRVRCQVATNESAIAAAISIVFYNSTAATETSPD